MGFKQFYIFEKTIGELRDDVSADRKVRSKPISSNLFDVNKSGTITFKSTAITTEGENSSGQWTQIMRPIGKVSKNVTLKELRELWNDDILVHCNCPDFHYRFGYRATQEDYKFGKKQSIPSPITNPSPTYPRGTICKHLENALSVVKGNLPKVLKDFREQ